MKITTLAELTEALAASASAYPVRLSLHNNTWRIGVEPETCTEVPAYASAPLTLRNEDQARRVLSNLDQLNVLAGWTGDAGMSLDLTPPVVIASTALSKRGK